MNKEKQAPNSCKCSASEAKDAAKPGGCCSAPKEINGFAAQGLLEPTRYGDWDVKGRCSDF